MHSLPRRNGYATLNEIKHGSLNVLIFENSDCAWKSGLFYVFCPKLAIYWINNRNATQGGNLIRVIN